MAQDQDKTVAVALKPMAAVDVRAEALAQTGPGDTAQQSHADRITQQLQGHLPNGDVAQTVRFDRPGLPNLPTTLPGYQMTAADTTPPASAALDRVARLVVGPTIASGGMGSVAVARQVSLDRDIAIKLAHSGSPRNTLALLEEARFAGRLQHPNIVPVYDLGIDAGNNLVLLMKRVEGGTWGEQLAQRPAPDDPQWSDWVAAQIAVLLQVCHAIAFAHANGVVHRDLKPINVMIGHFGEVYVLDWGIALELVDADGHPIVHPVDPDRVVGSVAYMAPEQAGVEPGGVTAQTDVFQLGAMLYQVLSGKPPFARKTVDESVLAMCACAPAPLPDDVPAELAAICQNALAKSPAQRTQTVADFARELARYLQRRPSLSLTKASLATLAQLRQAADSGATLDELYALFGQTRFGLQQALVAWPENAEAAVGLQATFAVTTAALLDRGSLTMAQTLYRELRAPEPALTAKLHALQQAEREKAAEVQRLQAFARDHDKAFGSASRRVLMRTNGIVFALMFGMGQVWVSNGWSHITHRDILWSGALAAAVIGGVSYFWRAQLAATAVNRQLISVALGMAVVGEVFRVIVAWQGMAVPEIQVLDLCIYALTGATMAAMFGYRLLWMSALFALAAAVGVVYPQWLLGLTGAALFAAFWMMDAVLGRHERRVIVG